MFREAYDYPEFTIECEVCGEWFDSLNLRSNYT